MRSYTAFDDTGLVEQTTNYFYDALGRVVRESESHPSGGPSLTTTITDMSYQGDTTNLAEEVVWEEVTSGQANARVKTYSHDPFGESVSMSEQWAGQAVNHFSYLHDPGSSVSLLLDNAGYVKESYAYTGYGQANSALSKKASGFSEGAVPVNPIRFQGKRWDSGSSGYDMGARRYSPSVGRWLQQDLYYDALDNLGLSEDPLTANRYAFLGANPVNYVEWDGHRPRYFECAIVISGTYCHYWGPQYELPIRRSTFSWRKLIADLSGYTDASEAIKAARRGDWRTATISGAFFAIQFVPAGKLAKAGALARAMKARRIEREGGLNLFKLNDITSTRATGWREGDRFLSVPWKGSPKATWKENASRLRAEMRSGRPIYETFVNADGTLKPTRGFLNAERNLLRRRGWSYNRRIRAWMPKRGQ